MLLIIAAFACLVLAQARRIRRLRRSVMLRDRMAE